MFYFFSPIKHHKMEGEVLRAIQRKCKVDLDKHTYCYKFIYYDPDLEIYGGVFLHKKFLNSLIPMAVLEKDNPHVWVAVDIFFESENSKINDCVADFDWHYQNFFRMMYEQLTNFSVAHHVEEIFTQFGEEIHEDTVVFGKWLLTWAAHIQGGMMLSRLTFDRPTYQTYISQWKDDDYRP